MTLKGEKAKEIARLYISRGAMTRAEFLAEHRIKEHELRAAMRGPCRPLVQTELPFVSEERAKTDRERIAELEASNRRLLASLKAAMRALEVLRDKADASVASIRLNLG